MKVLTFCFVIFLAGFSNLTYAQQTAKKSPAGTCYMEYLPDGYNGNTNKYPIVISLHGIGEKGNTITDVTKVTNVSLAKYVKQGTKYPFLIISPQLKTSMGRWTGDYVMEVVNYVKTYLRVDPNRIYLTGLSLGGGGVWSVSTSYPDVFAAIVPICSGYNVAASACKLASSNVPVWAFHGDKDATVGESVTINMVNAINNCSPKPSPLAKMTIFPGLGHMIWDRVYKDTNAINWMLGFKKGTSASEPDEPAEQPTDDKQPNVAPVAKAGSDKIITLPTNSITVNGSATDSDGTISSYTWTKTYGGSLTMSGTNTKDLILSNLKQGAYIFVLTVKDDKGATDTDAMKVTVKAATTTTNVTPVANAGSDKTLTLPSNSTTLAGAGSDTDGSISSYTWTKTGGGAVSMSGATSSDLKLSNLAAGSYSFQLTVKDNDGATDSDVVVVTVKSATTTTNKAPIANAGANKFITLPTNSTTVYGSGSDSDGTIGSYSWRKRSGGTVTMSGTTSKDLKVSNLKEGSYVFELTVKDNDGATHIDAMLLNVLSSTTK